MFGVYIYIYFSFLNDFDLLVVPIGVFGSEGTTGWNQGVFWAPFFHGRSPRTAKVKRFVRKFQSFQCFFFEVSNSCIRSFMHLILSFTQEKTSVEGILIKRCSGASSGNSH